MAASARPPSRADVDGTDASTLPAWALPGDLRPIDPGATLGLQRAALVAFAAAALRAGGARPADALATAETLVLADARGHASHGVSRLRQNLRLMASGSVDPRARYEVLRRRAAIESWDAHRGLGPAVGRRAMDRAIARARRTGLAAVIVRDSGHFGIAGAYVLRAMAAGCIGIASCNTDARVVPTGAAAAGLGTNPIAIGAPDGEGRGFLLDMATSVVALGKVEIARRAGRSIPSGWALDADGRPTTDPATALGGSLLPLGGQAETAGYKGYGLAAAVDLLTGVLGGGAFGRSVTGLWDTGQPSAVSQLHLVIDPASISDGGRFAARLRAWQAELTSLPRAEGVAEIVVPGEPEWRADARQAERLEVLAATVIDLADLAVSLDLRGAWRSVARSLVTTEGDGAA